MTPLPAPRDAFLAYAFPAANGARVAKLEMARAGVPFLHAGYPVVAHGADRGNSFTRLDTATADARRSFPCGWSADTLYFLGLAPSSPGGSGGWYVQTGDHARDFFIGDPVGEIAVRYADGGATVVPLVIGFTAWWGEGWDPALAPFGTPGPARDALAASCFLHDPLESWNGAYVLAVRPRRGAVIERIDVRNNPARAGWPTLFALTVERPSATTALVPFFRFRDAAPAGLSILGEDDLADTDGIARRLEALQRTVYTFADSLPATVPVEPPPGYDGPRLRFLGGPVADMLSAEHLHCLDGSILNGSELKCRDLGGYSPFGTWSPAGIAGGHTWTRDLGRILVERLAAGRLEDVRRSIETYDRLLYGLGGHRPLPLPHWVQNYLLDGGDVRFDGQCHYPRSTRTGDVVVGNLENDGHGLLMLARRRYWLCSGRDRSWLEATWDATRDAAEWVCWQLDNPLDVASLASDDPGEWLHCFHDPERRHLPDCLWSESESTYYGGCEIWTSIAGYAGLRASAEMAEGRGDREAAARWTAYADRLRSGILRHLVVDDPVWGPVWRVLPVCNWRMYNHALAPLIIMADLAGWDHAEHDPAFRDATLATYRARIHAGPGGTKCFDHVRCFGYGQAFLTEAALLLDEMGDAGALVERLATAIHSPHYLPWICPEGAAVHESGRYWHRTGGVGNEVQIASVVRVMRMVAGVDDTRPERVRIMPRLPAGWRGIEARSVPLASAAAGGGGCIPLDFDYRCETDRRHRLDVRLGSPLPALEARFGPFERSLAGQRAIVSVDGASRAARTEASGDSCWAWVRGLPERRELAVVVTVEG